jgi:hypothetical protein
VPRAVGNAVGAIIEREFRVPTDPKVLTDTIV